MKSEDGPLIVMRPATADDETFANDLLFRTMHAYVEATWPNDPTAQRRYYEINKCDPSNTRILQIEGKDIGRLSTTVRTDCVFIDELHILPKHQRRGIGQQAIMQVLKEARERNLPVKLHVLTANPAQKLYLRMGFRVIAHENHRLHMVL
jgi:GNAT superfamily N-acetyltransferase